MKLDFPPVVTYLLLAAYAAILLYAINAPAKQPDPQRGMAVGCLLFVLAGVVLATIAFTIGLVLGARWLSDGVTGLCLLVLALILLGLLESLVRWLRTSRPQ